MPRQYRRLPDKDPCHESAEHSMDADGVRHQRHDPGNKQDCGNDRQFADELVIGPTDQTEDQPTPNRETERQEYRDADQTLGNRGQIDPTVQCEPESDRHDNPADRVIDNRR